MDIVYIRELEVRTIIGIFDWEREQRQVVSLDLEMGSDIAAAAATDTIENALDYKAVAKRLIDFIEKSDFFFGRDACRAGHRYCGERIQCSLGQAQVR